MNHLYSKKSVLGLLFLIGAAASSCAHRTDDKTDDKTDDLVPPTSDSELTDEARIVLLEQRYKARLAAHPFNTVSGTVRDLDSQPLAGVSVRIGNTSIMTGEDGTYSATMPLGQYLVTFEHLKYVTVQRAVQVKLGNSSQIDGYLLLRSAPKHFDADTGARITEGPLSLVIEPGDLTFRDGTPVHGEIEITIGVIDPRKKGHVLAAPAELDGIDDSGKIVLLWSLGMLEVEMKKDGKMVQVQPGKTVEAIFDVEGAELKTGTKIPMWHHDTSLGIWVQERGTDATLRRSPEGKLVASALLPHFSAWNLDVPTDAVCATINIPVKTGTTTASLKVNSVTSGGTPDNRWSIVAPCQVNTNSGVAVCAFNVPANDPIHSEVYFRLEGSTNLTSGYLPLNVTLVGSPTSYDVLRMTTMRDFLSTNGIPAGSWCGNKKFTTYEVSGTITLDPMPAPDLPLNRIRFGYPISNPPLLVGSLASVDPGFSVILTNERNLQAAVNADSDLKNDIGAGRDNCVQNNHPQTDANNNGIGDACEAWCNVAPGPDAVWFDYDLDGIDDMCDNKWTVYNPSQAP